MRVASLLAVCMMAAGSVLAQADFEAQTPPCAYLFPAGCGAAGDPEGVFTLGAGAVNVDATANGAGFPCTNLQYGRVTASGPIPSPIGGPYAGGGTEMFIPIFTDFALCWDFYNAEGGQTATFNDGMSIDLVGADCTTVLQNLAYVDTANALGAGFDGGACGSFATEITPNGPQTVTVLAASGATYVRIACWNGGDNAVSSTACVDITPIPCLLSISAGMVPGGYQIAVANSNCTPNSPYFTCITLNQGAFPNGFWFGVDPLFGELIAELNTPAPPFNGVTDGSGASLWTVLLPAGPLGVTVYGVTVTHNFATINGVSAPISVGL